MYELVQPALNKFKGRTINMLSIGCGGGIFEDTLVKKMGLELGSYHGVEPSENHINQLREKAATWNLKELKMYPQEWNQSFTTDRKFDVALFSHSIYYMKDPKAMMEFAQTFLNPGGEVWNFMQAENDLLNFKFDDLSTLPMSEMHKMTHQHLVSILQEWNVAHSADTKPFTLDMTDFMEHNRSKRGVNIINFMLQTKYENMSEDHQKEIFKFVKEICVQQDGKWLILWAVGMIRLEAIH